MAPLFTEPTALETETAEPPSPAPRPFGERKLRARIVKTRLGYYAHLTYGLARVGESGGGPFSFTRRGLERKIERTARRLRREDARQAAAEELIL